MSAARRRPPNIVLFISDQQRHDTAPGSVRRAPGRTPHLDRLADEGLTFTRAFCAAPICSPSRASMLTGLFPHAHGLVANHQGRPGSDRLHLAEDARVLGDYLGSAGYRTGYVGKWHLGTGSDRRGFRDYVVRFGDGEGDTSRPEDNDYYGYTQRLGVQIGGKRLGKDPDPERYDRRIQCGPSLMPLAHQAAFFNCERAARFIVESAGHDRPFALVYSCIEPHQPFVCPEPFHSMYEPADIDLPANLSDRGGQALLSRADRQLHSALEFSEQDLRLMWASYLGTVSYVDFLVGKLHGALLETGQLDDTLFVFTSDHGELLGSHSLLFKGPAMYEELVRVPLIVRPPAGWGAKAPRTVDALVSQVDLVPTLLGVAGLEAPGELHGVDVGPILGGGADAGRTAVQAHFHSSNWAGPVAPLRMWRTAEWKWVESGGDDNELYQLAEDPDELRNLAEDQPSLPTRERLADELASWCHSVGDSWPEVPMPSEEDVAVERAYRAARVQQR